MHVLTFNMRSDTYILHKVCDDAEKSVGEAILNTCLRFPYADGLLVREMHNHHILLTLKNIENLCFIPENHHNNRLS